MENISRKRPKTALLDQNKYKISPGGTWSLGGYIYSRFRVWPSHPSIYQNFMLKTHPSTKITHRNTNFSFQTHQSTKIWYSEPFHLPKFYNFGAPNPSIYQNLTIFWKITHPSFYIGLPKPILLTSIICIHENM